MKKFAMGLLLLSFFACEARAQTAQVFKQFSTSVVAADVGINETGSGITQHRLAWSGSTATLSTCTVELDQSSDNATWSTLIAGQTCTTAGSSTVTTGVNTYVRINVTAISGGTVYVNYIGYLVSATTAGGGVTAVTGTTPIVSSGGATPAISCPTCSTGSGISGLTSKVIPQAASATSIANSSPQLDNGLTTTNALTYAGSAGITASAGPVTAGGSAGVGGTLTLPEGTAASAVIGDDICYADSTAHRIECSFNFGSFSIVPTLAATNAFTGTNTFKTIGTATECASSASPAVCGSAASGFFVIAAAAGTVTVDTSAVTANSIIEVGEDFSLGTALSVTCNTATAPGFSAVTARTPGVSFTFAVTNTPSVYPDCFSYFIIN